MWFSFECLNWFALNVDCESIYIDVLDFIEHLMLRLALQAVDYSVVFFLVGLENEWKFQQSID